MGRSIKIIVVAAGLTISAPAAGKSLDRVFETMRAAGFSGTVVAGDRQEITFKKTAGLADRERGRKHRLDQRWPWASVTKQVTAALVMAEVDRGRLSLDAPVRALLPEFSGQTGDQVTVRHLLQHTSGLPNPGKTPLTTDGVPSFYRESGTGISNTARARGFCSGPPDAAPGAGFTYNNCDTLILGAILERLTSRSYAALVEQAISRPFKLQSVRHAKDDLQGAGLGITGYEEGKQVPPMNFAALGAGGALAGTASDLVRFNQALMAHKLVSPSSTGEMWKGDPKLGYVALGVWSFPAQLEGCSAPVALIERRGHFGGMQVRSLIAPELGRTVVAFTNNGDLEFGEIWQGRGLTHSLASAAFCSASKN